MPAFEFFPDENHLEKLAIVRQFPALFGTESEENAGYWGQKRGKYKMNDTESAGWILHPPRILHPILHRKFPIYKGVLKDWCRKCRRKTKNFFWRSRLRKCKTSDFFEANLRTFGAKHRNFTSKKSDVFDFRTSSAPPKKRRHKEPISETSNPQLRA